MALDSSVSTLESSVSVTSEAVKDMSSIFVRFLLCSDSLSSFFFFASLEALETFFFGLHSYNSLSWLSVMSAQLSLLLSSPPWRLLSTPMGGLSATLIGGLGSSLEGLASCASVGSTTAFSSPWRSSFSPKSA